MSPGRMPLQRSGVATGARVNTWALAFERGLMLVTAMGVSAYFRIFFSNVVTIWPATAG